jgi:hypothetical protein
MLKREFLLGDGIEDVQTDRKGHIWVAYFDEGVFGARVLLYGGYGEQRNACKLLNLGAEKAEIVAEITLLFPQEVDLSKASVVGRDNFLHVFSGDSWHILSMESLS